MPSTLMQPPLEAGSKAHGPAKCCKSTRGVSAGFGIEQPQGRRAQRQRGRSEATYLLENPAGDQVHLGRGGHRRQPEHVHRVPAEEVFRPRLAPSGVSMILLEEVTQPEPKTVRLGRLNEAHNPTIWAAAGGAVRMAPTDSDGWQVRHPAQHTHCGRRAAAQPPEAAGQRARRCEKKRSRRQHRHRQDDCSDERRAGMGVRVVWKSLREAEQSVRLHCGGLSGAEESGSDQETNDEEMAVDSAHLRWRAERAERAETGKCRAESGQYREAGGRQLDDTM